MLPQRIRNGVFILLLVIFAFSFLGSRGISNRDEGRYLTVALEMLWRHDFFTLRLNEDWLHYTKPPLLYYGLAGAMMVFGENEWAARLPSVLAFLLMCSLLYGFGRDMYRDRPALPVVVFALSALPYMAGSMICTDVLLAAAETAAFFCGWKSWRADAGYRRRYWRWAMWVCWGLAFMTKGPAALVPLPALLVYAGLQEGGKGVRRLFGGVGPVLFLVVGFSWYVLSCVKIPGLLHYWVQTELLGRMHTHGRGRNAQWYGPLSIYLPTLLLGLLPWTATALTGFGNLVSRLRREPASWRAVTSGPKGFALLWFAVPMILFTLLPGRLPLYILPLFAPLALLISWTLPRDFLDRRKTRVLLASWVVFLIGIRLLLSLWDIDHNDGRRLARAIQQQVANPIDEVVFIGSKPLYALTFYLHGEVKRIEIEPHGDYGEFGKPVAYIEDSVAEPLANRVFAIKPSHVEQLMAFAERNHLVLSSLGTHHHLQFYRLERASGRR